MSYYARKKKKTEWLTSPQMMLVYRLISIILTLSISRWLLYIFNLQFFHHLDLREALALYFNGMRFDLVITVVLNLSLIIYYCFPAKFITYKVPQWIVDILFIVVNSTAIALNFADIIYFHYIGEHVTWSSPEFLRNSDEITGGFMRQVLFDHWYLIVIFVLFVLTIIVVTQRTRIKIPRPEDLQSWKHKQLISLPFALALSAIGIRGGIQKEPIRKETALEYADPQNAPILLNTPFSLLYSYDLTLEEWHRYEESTYSPIHYDLIPNRFVNDSTACDTVPDNLVLIILKGIGQEMIGYYNPSHRYPLTPFLDSLLSQSLTFDGRANALRTVQALPAILASLPDLMDDDFATSQYASNDFDAFAQHLKQRGYNTIFMHGGDNGTMDFDGFSFKSGFKNYYGRVEYDDDADYDQQWGIYDGPFLQYAARTLNYTHEPFATAIYTLSSRHPYNVPHDFKLPKESYFWTGFEKTVYYADCSLRDFFATAAKSDWFDHTLFVITSDFSNSEHFQMEYNNVWGAKAIPIAFYHPNHIAAQRSSEIAQQIDIGPSILSALQVNDTLFSLGRNLFDSLSEQAYVNYFNLTYSYCNGTYLVQSDGTEPFGIYRPNDDPTLENNLVEHLQCADVFDKLYQFIQEYNNRMINNKLRYDKEEDTLHHQPNFWQTPQEELAPAD